MENTSKSITTDSAMKAEHIKFYEEIAKESIEKLKLHERTKVYNMVLVPWMIVNQRVSQLSLEKVVMLLNDGGFRKICDPKSKKISESNISRYTGGYSKARNKLKKSYVIEIVDRISKDLLAQYGMDRLWHGKKVLLVDGTATALYGNEELNVKYPPCKNQHGSSDWSQPKILLLIDLMTGIALRPHFGPMFGEEATSETKLLKDAVSELVLKDYIIVGDRNFGILDAINTVVNNGNDCLFRLTTDRANKFLKLLKEPGEINVTWNPSSKELKKYDDIKPQKGRFIWFRSKLKGAEDQDYFFFTTLTNTKEEIADLYLKRWEVEKDIKSLKHVLKLDTLDVKTAEMFEKEFLLGIVAYNLIRDIMAFIARHANLDPKRLSFTAYAFRIQMLFFNSLASSCYDSLENFLNNLSKQPYINKVRKRPPQKRVVRKKNQPFPTLRGARSA
jgi:putative transposase